MKNADIEKLIHDHKLLMEVLNRARDACHQPVGKEHDALAEAINDYDQLSSLPSSPAAAIVAANPPSNPTSALP